MKSSSKLSSLSNIKKNKIYLLTSSSMNFITKATTEIKEFVSPHSNVYTYSSMSELWKELEQEKKTESCRSTSILFQVKPTWDVISLRNLISCSCSIPIYIVHIEPVSHTHNMKSFEYPHLRYPLYACDYVKKKEIISS